jgi:RNA polymerase sigma factor (sigma-70 family)
MTDIAASHLNTAKSLAHQMRIPTDSIDFDDFVQEGAVAAWIATKDRELEAPVTYGMVAAKRRIIGTLRGKHPMYGSEAEPGKRIYDQHRQVEKREIDVEGALADIPWRRDAYAEVERRVDVERALTGLSERDLVVAAMVGRGHDWQEISEALGTSKNAIWKQWTKNIKPSLQDRLGAQVA